MVGPFKTQVSRKLAVLNFGFISGRFCEPFGHSFYALLPSRSSFGHALVRKCRCKHKTSHTFRRHWFSIRTWRSQVGPRSPKSHPNACCKVGTRSPPKVFLIVLATLRLPFCIFLTDTNKSAYTILATLSWR